MQRNFNIEKDFILSDLQVFREYDLNNFVSNAKNTLHQFNDNIAAIKLDTYNTFINRSYADLQKTKLQYEEDPTVLEKEFSSVHFEQLDLQMKPIHTERIVIRPEYLTQFIQNIGLTLSRASKNLDSLSDINDEINKYISSDILFKVKKQMVRSDSLSCYSNMKDLIYRDEDVTIPVSMEMLEARVYPFLENYKALRKEIAANVSTTISAINNAKTYLTDYTLAVRNMQNELSPDNMSGRTKLNKVIYNTTRCGIEAASYLAFALIRKIGNFTESILSINKLCDDLAGSVSPATESVFDRGLTSSDSKSVGEGLLKGEVDAFRELAADAYEYNINLLTASPFHGTADLEEENIFSTIEFRVDQAEYNPKPYEDTLDMIGIISQGLDTVAANSDDYLVVFDDILDKSGFSMRLDDKFSGTFNLLDDVSEYESSVSISDGCAPSMDMYYKLLKEVRDMPKNMETIANAISECDAKINILSERFERNVNTEYRNTATIREVKDFLDSLDEEFHNLVIKVGGKFMIRLKTLTVLLEKMNKLNSKNLDSSIQLESSDEELYREYAEDVAFEEFITDTLFEAVEEAYVKERTRRLTGITLFKEDGDESGAGRSTAAAIMDKIDGMIKDLEEQMQKMIIKMQVYSGEKYVENHKGNLLNRNYSNVSSKSPIIEYAKIKPYGDMITDSESVNKKVAAGSLTTQKLLELKDDASIAKFVFPEVIGNILSGNTSGNTQSQPNNNGNNNNSSDNSSSTQIREFYKHGTYPSNPLTLKNNDLKTAVDDAITYCSQFNNGIWNKLMEIDKSIYNNLKEVNNQYKTESNLDYMIGQLFVEDNNNGGNNNTGSNTSSGTNNTTTSTTGSNTTNTNTNNTNQNQNQNNNNSNTQQNQNNNNQNNQQAQNNDANPNSIINATRPIKTIYNMCRTFTNGVMHAAADRYKDYIDLLHGVEAQTENDMDPRDSQEQQQPQGEGNTTEGQSQQNNGQ